MKWGQIKGSTGGEGQQKQRNFADGRQNNYLRLRPGARKADSMKDNAG